MTIQRQYSLPNCTLVLEGLSDPTMAAQADARPIMSLLINAECHLPGQKEPLAGGREFFESLVTAVSLYAQEFLSGIHLPRHIYSDKPSFVKLERLDRSHHRISVEPSPDHTTTKAQSLNLTTVQLFDLVEAIDQFVADTQTLPFWSLNLAPVPKRFAGNREPVTKQVVPAAIGASTLALAAIAFFALPTPKVNRPACLMAGECPTATTPNPTDSPSASPGVSPSPTTQASGSPSPSPIQPDLAQLEATLNSTPAITDPQELDRLQQKLSEQIDQKWQDRSKVSQDLVYRVGVGKDGAIVGYKPESPGALENVKLTPLLELLYIPAAGSTVAQEAIGQFKVVFMPEGKIEVTPWENSASASPEASPSPTPSASPEASPSPTPSASPTPSVSPAASPTSSSSAGAPAEITEAPQLEALQPKVFDQIDQNWKGSPPFDQDLTFRVRAKADGAIVDYEPVNSAASSSAQFTPLPQLGKLADPNATPSESLASFKVVFKPSGALQISPWYGRR